MANGQGRKVRRRPNMVPSLTLVTRGRAEAVASSLRLGAVRSGAVMFERPRPGIAQRG